MSQKKTNPPSSLKKSNMRRCSPEKNKKEKTSIGVSNESLSKLVLHPQTSILVLFNANEGWYENVIPGLQKF
jgi:hypothetical protein